MEPKETYASKIRSFNDFLMNVTLTLPDGFDFINPFNGEQSDLVWKLSESFYSKYYGDTHQRRIILGSSPARRGSAVIGVPFEDSNHLEQVTGICMSNFYINKSSSNFLFDVIEEYGGFKKFYKDYYMNFVCPLGITRTNVKGRKVNCNYYESKELQHVLEQFIIKSIQMQIDFGIDRTVCICIGSGENYAYLEKLNSQHKFFKHIISLEHPRYITQYNSDRKDEFLKKYLTALQIV